MHLVWGGGESLVPGGAPLGEECALGGVVGDGAGLGFLDQAGGVAGIDAQYADYFFVDGKIRQPAAAADLGCAVGTFFDAAGAVGGGVAGEQFLQAGAEIDLPSAGEPFGLVVGEGRPLDGKRGRRGEGGVHLAGPAGAFVREGIVGGDVGFDIKNGGAVHEVAGAEEEAVFFDGEELDGRHAKEIGTMGGAGGEDAAADGGTARGEDHGAPGVVFMKPPNEPDAGKSCQVAEAVFVAVAGDEFEDVLFRGGFGGLVEGVEFGVFSRSDKSDGVEGVHGGGGWVERGLPGVELGESGAE